MKKLVASVISLATSWRGKRDLNFLRTVLPGVIVHDFVLFHPVSKTFPC